MLQNCSVWPTRDKWKYDMVASLKDIWDLLYSTGHYIQYLVIISNGKESYKWNRCSNCLSVTGIFHLASCPKIHQCCHILQDFFLS